MLLKSKSKRAFTQHHLLGTISCRKNGAGFIPLEHYGKNKRLDKSRLSLTGFTLVELLIVVAIIALLVSIALPNFARARDNARHNICLNNLRLMAHSAEEYITINDLVETVVCTEAQIGSFIKGEKIPFCPAAGTYSFGAGTVTCSTHGTFDINTGMVS